ncbi:MAG: hypothetical protein GY737_29360 [Desulfobacteraceae bacterium]|nr:hypothetical protein [Desulfobacteraceae bacterium]
MNTDSLNISDSNIEDGEPWIDIPEEYLGKIDHRLPYERLNGTIQHVESGFFSP